MTTTTNRAAKTAAAKPEPPAAAVAADAHWAAKMERLRARQSPTATLRICDDDDAKADLARAERLQGRTADEADLEPDDPEVKRRAENAAAAVERARQRVEDATLVVLHFRGLPRPAFLDLVKKHPPTEEQAEDGHEWNEDTFAPALISAASVDGMTVDDAGELLTTWATQEANNLFNAAYQPQLANRTDLGKG
jgi:hypothetical protein